MSSRDLSYSNFVPITPKTEGVLPQSLVGGLQQNLQRGTQLIEVNGMDSDDGGSTGKLHKLIYFSRLLFRQIYQETCRNFEMKILDFGRVRWQKGWLVKAKMPIICGKFQNFELGGKKSPLHRLTPGFFTPIFDCDWLKLIFNIACRKN